MITRYLASAPFSSLAALAGLLLAACGGGGGGGGGGGAGDASRSPATSHSTGCHSKHLGNGLEPCRHGRIAGARSDVEAIERQRTVLATTTTDSNGNYSVSVPANSNMFIRVRAQMLKSGQRADLEFHGPEQHQLGRRRCMC